MINQVTIVGRMVRDPELRFSGEGVAIGNFTLAVSRAFKKDEADFIPVVCFKKIAENVANYQKKGSLVGVTGRIQTRNYENKDGVKVFVTEVIADSVAFLESKGKGQGSAESHPNKALEKNDDPFSQDGKPIDIQDDDLPF